MQQSAYVCASRAKKEAQPSCPPHALIMHRHSLPLHISLFYIQDRCTASQWVGTVVQKSRVVFCVFTLNLCLWKSLMCPKPSCCTYTSGKQLCHLAPGKPTVFNSKKPRCFLWSTFFFQTLSLIFSFSNEAVHILYFLSASLCCHPCHPGYAFQLCCSALPFSITPKQQSQATHSFPFFFLPLSWIISPFHLSHQVFPTTTVSD